MSRKNIAIVMGGYSNEYDISLRSGNVVYQHLDRSRYNPYRVLISKEGWYGLDDQDQKLALNRSDFSLSLPEGPLYFDAVFNAIHGTPGEDGILQAYLELIDLPQTSCDFYRAALTFNKRDCISILKPYGIPVARNHFLNQGQEYDVEKIIERVGLPCFVKANKAGSSYGITKVKRHDEMDAAIAHAFAEDDEVIIESFLSGTEVSVGVIRYEGKPKVLPITEIVSENEFFDFAAKYEGKSQEITPARISESQQELVETLALKVYEVLKMTGFTRSEYIFHNGAPHFIEINTTPGLSEASILPQQAAAAGIELPELFASAIEDCLERAAADK
ncbi:D-alanine--D-alanine ligase [Croceiramulus getboli]|nr:D-alanine--D-alanine ligase [Flavobacteriaceae bacterium YJPT1-3]